MKAKDIKVGEKYIAKVSNKLTTVQVMDIRQSSVYNHQVYDVKNLATGRKTTFKSAQKFRRIAIEQILAKKPIEQLPCNDMVAGLRLIIGEQDKEIKLLKAEVERLQTDVARWHYVHDNLVQLHSPKMSPSVRFR